jgi:hypothetical protein
MSDKTDFLTLNSDVNLLVSSSQLEQFQKNKPKVKLIEKATYNRKKEYNFEVRSRKNENKKERKDANGEIINHKNKRKIKVTFRDKINPEIGLVDIINIESIKEYNYIPSENGYIDIYNLKKKNKCCCSIY